MLLDAPGCLRIRSRSFAVQAGVRGTGALELVAKPFVRRTHGRCDISRSARGSWHRPAAAGLGAGSPSSFRRSSRAQRVTALQRVGCVLVPAVRQHLEPKRSCQCARQRLEFIRDTPIRGLSAGERAARHASDTLSMTIVSFPGRSVSRCPSGCKGRAGAAAEIGAERRKSWRCASRSWTCARLET